MGVDGGGGEEVSVENIGAIAGGLAQATADAAIGEYGGDGVGVGVGGDGTVGGGVAGVAAD